jgi:hypothetical protein
MLIPALVESIETLELPSVEPVQDGIELPDIGAVISGLTPPLLISVEPSGIVPPLRVKLELPPIGASGDAVPVALVMPPDELADPQAGLVVEPNPPPSKAELAPDIDAMPDPLALVTPEDIPEDEDPLALQIAPAAGLSPPGSTSVAPSGMPVMLFDPEDMLEPNMPRGEVAGIPGVVIVLCACAALQPSRTATAMAETTLMRSSFVRVSRPPPELLRRARVGGKNVLLASARCVEIALASLVQLLSGRLLHDGLAGRVIITLLELVEFLRGCVLHDGVGRGVVVPLLDQIA